MDDGAGSLAGLLSALKERSGLSFAELARRTHTSRSTLHRYCSGTSVPDEDKYDIVLAFAKECGATPRELNDLFRHWTIAVAAAHGRPLPEDASDGRPPHEEASAPPPDTVDETAETTPSKNGATTRRPAAWRRRFLQVTGAVAAVVVLVGAGVWLGVGRRNAPAHADPGGRWTWAPWPVPSSMFGVTINSNTGTMPSFQVGRVRFWDGATRWADLEPRRGAYTWTSLDRLVNGARHAGLPALYTFGGTPKWAAPDGPPTVYTDGSRAAPPDDLADWDAFVRALVRRYRGRLEAYELWDSANDRHFYTGDPASLVAMVDRASRIIKAADPDATVVCPSMGGLTGQDGLRFVERFAELGGYRKCDAGGIKLFPRSSHDPPETLVPVLDSLNRTLHRAGTGLPLWDTGPNYDVPLLDQLQGDQARDFAVRFFLVGLYGLDLGLRRTYFYNWGGSRVPVVLQVEGEPATPAARGVETLERWLAGASVQGCGHGAGDGLPSDVWQCRLTTGTIRWTSRGGATTPVGARPVVVRRLDGTTARIPAGHTLRVTESPVFVTPG